MKLFRVFLFILFILFIPISSFSQKTKEEATSVEEYSGEFELSVFEKFDWLNCQNPKSYLSNQDNLYLLVYVNEYSALFGKTINYLEDLKKEYPTLLVTLIHIDKYAQQGKKEHFYSMVVNNGIKFPVVNVNDLDFVKKMEIDLEPTSFLFSNILGTVNFYEGFWELENVERDLAHLMELEQDNPFLAETMPTKSELDRISMPICKQMSHIIAAPSFGWLFVSVPAQHQIIAIDTYGTVVDYIGTGKKGYNDSSASNTTFNSPKGMAWDNSTNTLYIADSENNCIRKYTYADPDEMDPKQRARVETYIDETTFFIESEELDVGPEDISIDGKTMFIAMKGTNEIWTYNMEEEEFERFSFAKNENKELSEIATPIYAPVSITNPAGSPTHIYCQGNNRMMNFKEGKILTSIKFDFDNVPFSNIFSNGKYILALSPLNNQIRVYEGDKLKKVIGKKQAGYKNGKLKDATFYEPFDMAFLNGNYYVVDRGNNSIRKINSKLKKVSTLYIEDIDLLIEAKHKDADEKDIAIPEINVNAGQNKIKFKLDLDSKYELVPSSVNLGFDLGPHINEGTFLAMDAEDFNDGIINASIDNGESATYSKLIVTLLYRKTEAPHNLYYKKLNLQITYKYEEDAPSSHVVSIPMN